MRSLVKGKFHITIPNIMDSGKRSLLSLLFVFFIFTVNAKTYYVSSGSGNDSYTAIQAQDPATPWKTLAKVNSFFNNLAAGDIVLLKCGEVFAGPLIVTKSGSGSFPITFSSFGNGAKPVITGFTKLTAWEDQKNGTWQADCINCTPALNMVTVDGVQRAVGRYPNTGYLSYESHNGITSITDKQLSGSPNWTGAELVIRKKDWTMEKAPITAHNGNTINYASVSNYEPTNGYGYFIQRDLKTLDQFGEWYFDKERKKLTMFFGRAPSPYDVEVSTQDVLVSINRQNNITFDNLSFKGSNVATFQVIFCNSIHVQNCDIDFSGLDAINTSGGNNCLDFLLENSTVNHSNNNAFRGGWAYNGVTIRNNVILNSGTIPGMGASDDDSYDAVANEGYNLTFENNRVDNVGHIGVRFEGDNDLIKNNFITNFTLTKFDGSGIYTFTMPTDKVKHKGQKVIGNIVIGRPAPTSDEGTGSPNGGESNGIYLDVYPANIEVSGNSVANCLSDGILINGAINMTIDGNTCFNNLNQIDHNTQWDRNTNYDYTRNLNITRNIFFSTISKQQTMKFSNRDSDLPIVTDDNYYCGLNAGNLIYRSLLSGGTLVNKFYSLLNWTGLFNEDTHSNNLVIKPTDVVRFEYNGFNQNKVVDLGQMIYVDVKNTKYTSKIVLQPFTSLILISTGVLCDCPQPKIQFDN